MHEFATNILLQQFVYSFYYRCMNLLSTSYHNNLWGDQIDFNLVWMEKILLNIETTNNITMACIAIEVLAKFVSFAPKNTVLQV